MEGHELVRTNNLMERADLMLFDLILIKECLSITRGGALRPFSKFWSYFYGLCDEMLDCDR